MVSNTLHERRFGLVWFPRLRAFFDWCSNGPKEYHNMVQSCIASWSRKSNISKQCFHSPNAVHTRSLSPRSRQFAPPDLAANRPGESDQRLQPAHLARQAAAWPTNHDVDLRMTTVSSCAACARHKPLATRHRLAIGQSVTSPATRIPLTDDPSNHSGMTWA